MKKSLVERGKRGDIRNFIMKGRDQVLSCFDYLDYEKVRMVTYEFRSYALRDKEGRRRHSDTWSDLKRELRLSSIPTLYARDLL
ncbi:hypothetical protein CR513_00443, partial [Mucuna pruriens]